MLKRPITILNCFSDTMGCHIKSAFNSNYLDDIGSSYCDVSIHFESGEVLKESFHYCNSFLIHK